MVSCPSNKSPTDFDGQRQVCITATTNPVFTCVVCYARCCWNRTRSNKLRSHYVAQYRKGWQRQAENQAETNIQVGVAQARYTTTSELWSVCISTTWDYTTKRKQTVAVWHTLIPLHSKPLILDSMPSHQFLTEIHLAKCPCHWLIWWHIDLHCWLPQLWHRKWNHYAHKCKNNIHQNSNYLLLNRSSMTIPLHSVGRRKEISTYTAKKATLIGTPSVNSIHANNAVSEARR